MIKIKLGKFGKVVAGIEATDKKPHQQYIAMNDQAADIIYEELKKIRAKDIKIAISKKTVINKELKHKIEDDLQIGFGIIGTAERNKTSISTVTRIRYQMLAERRNK